jgi:hypothetical protein
MRILLGDGIWSHTIVNGIDCLKSEDVVGLENFDFSIFHVITLLLFVLAVIHTFSTNIIRKAARKMELRIPKRHKTSVRRAIGIQFLYFLAEVEIVFVLWAIPLFIIIVAMHSWHTALSYLNTRDYTEPLFVVVILALTSTRPIVALAESLLHRLANRLGGTLSCWWFTLLTVGPLMGSFITETGAMALCALLLSRQFYHYKPSSKLAYATLGLLFVNVSIGGGLTDFASPAVLVLSHCWGWDMLYMFLKFGWKAALGIVISNTIYWTYFRKELREMNDRKELMNRVHTPDPEEPTGSIPYWITGIHILVIAWIVVVSHYPAVFIGSFILFLGFHQATRHHQYSIRLARPLLVGLFLAGLAIHGGLQGWWVVDLLQRFSPLGVMGVSLMLTGFMDNTGISYLATLVPSWGDAYKYALFSGVVAGGGLTVIANAPNPAGFVLLGKHFKNGISPLNLFLSAALPTFVLYLIYFCFGPFF